MRLPIYRDRYAEILAAIVDSGDFSPQAWRALYERQVLLYTPWLVNDTGQDEVMRPAGEEAWIARRIRAVRTALNR